MVENKILIDTTYLKIWILVRIVLNLQLSYFSFSWFDNASKRTTNCAQHFFNIVMYGFSAMIEHVRYHIVANAVGNNQQEHHDQL